MCGLFGVFTVGENSISTSDITELNRLGKKAQRRGVDASGLISVSDDRQIRVVKANHSFESMVKTRVGHELLKSAKKQHTVALFGHSRLETHGYSGSSENNQPVVLGSWVVVHNGVITNADEIRFNTQINDLGIETDSVAIALLLEKWDRDGRSYNSDEVFNQLSGEYSIIAASTSGEVLCRTNVGNLYFATGENEQIFIASEPRQFSKELQQNCSQVELNETVTLHESSQDTGSIFVHTSIKSEVGMEGAQGLHLGGSQVDLDFSKSMEQVALIAQDRAKGLRRCNVCILPETFPGIHFNEDGVCSICLDFELPEYSGLDSLAEDLQNELTESGEVLVCLSGGRDSSYILHLVHHLGFKPIAYTYDWGMVTTAARENMSQMCGDLGVEHIVVSPDIRRNRTRINRALSSWLKNPKLATIPILMAGDKPYFRWGQEVARERGGIPVLMADHPMETTGFKSMLAGAKTAADHSQGTTYRLNISSMTKMIYTYGAHAIQSPGLMPSLIKEGLIGFVDYYIRDHKFLKPFSYIPWEEELIETTLRSEYAWSSGEDRSVTPWRMGDGTAPFYNLMYLIGLGMTEHDTLRSNQIRFGLIERQEALEKGTRDNSFNALGLASYFATVGIDLKWAGGHIQRFASHYQ